MPLGPALLCQQLADALNSRRKEFKYVLILPSQCPGVLLREETGLLQWGGQVREEPKVA